jgi:hypothetical protein
MIETSRDNKILSPGDCQIEMVVLSSYNGFQIDITSHITEIVINESMDYSCLSGYIHIADNINLMRNVPLIGNEHVTISFVTPSRPKKIQKKFFCYKTDARSEDNNNKGVIVYRLHFVSEEFVTSSKKKISLSLRDMKYSDMVRDIFNKNLNTSKNLTTQPTVENKNLIVPYMSPLDAIDMIALKSVGENARDKSYMFYEDLDGFYFCNINYYAIDRTPKVEYTWFKQNLSEERDPVVLKNIEKEFYRIENYEILTGNNTLNNISNGLYGSMLLLHDITFKTVNAIKFSYNSDFNKLTTIYNNGILPKNNDRFSSYNLAHYRMYPRQTYAYDNVEVNDDYDRMVLERNAHMAQLENSKLTILVAGDSQRRIGEVVAVNIPSSQPGIGNEEQIDPYLSGNYIVTQITHMISPFYYKMRLYLERDSMPLAYPESKEVELS